MTESAPPPDSPPGTCTEEGFFPSPDDHTRFYRCVVFDGVLTRFDFQCSPGTVYNPELIACVHPWEMPPDHPAYSERPA